MTPRANITYVLASAIVTVLGACQTRPGPETGRWGDGPIVRVRISDNVTNALFMSDGELIVGVPTRTNRLLHQKRFIGPITITRGGATFAIATQRSKMRLTAPSVHIKPAQSDVPLHVDGTAYPGAMTLATRAAADRYDVVAHVHVEAYLPGVLGGELPSNWHINAYRAQAIAARTYALAQLAPSRHKHFDLEATTASQVYEGLNAHDAARRAVRDTAGVVLAWDGRIFPAYYSSTCGGAGQDARFAFPAGENIAPLHGNVRGTWCVASKYYRWGPIDRDAHGLASRISAWAKQSGHPVAALTSIRDICVTERNRADRPVQFTITDGRGRAFQLNAEPFRFACNHTSPGLPAPSSPLRSSHVEPRVIRSIVRFEHGRGFGHGVGLCQFGAQAMAAQGRDYGAILNTYYPGARMSLGQAVMGAHPESRQLARR